MDPDADVTVIQARTVRITDFAVTEDVIANHRFENCVIFGPAVLAPLDSVSFVRSGFDGTPAALFWEVPPERTQVIGAIGLVNCHFERCRFTRVGFAGPQQFLEYFRSNVFDPRVTGSEESAAESSAGSPETEPPPGFGRSAMT